MRILRSLVREIVLLEDSRGNIVRLLGFSKEHADEFHEMFGKDAFLSALIFKKAFESPNENSRNESVDEYMSAYFEYDWSDNHGRILEFLKKHHIKASKLLSLTYEQLSQLIDDLATSTIDVGVLEDRAVLKFDDGYFWIKLNPDEYKSEGTLMKHCGADPDLDRFDNCAMYSLRDSSGMPHITLTLVGQRIMQVVGKANSRPKRQYWNKITEFAKMLGASLGSFTNEN